MQEIPNKIFLKITSSSILAYRPEEIDQGERQDDMVLVEYERVKPAPKPKRWAWMEIFNVTT